MIDSAGLYGAENVLLDLMDAQRDLGHTPVLCSIGQKSIDEKPIEIEAHRRKQFVRKIRMGDGPNITGLFHILDYARKEKFDILHSHGYKTDIFFGWMPRRIRRLPMVTTLHGWTDIRKFRRLWLYRWLQIRCLRNVERIVVVNSELLEHRDLKHIQEKMRVIRNGIKPLDFSEELISEDHEVQKFCRGKYIIGAIGRLSREKGYIHLLHAFQELTRRYDDIGLVILVMALNIHHLNRTLKNVAYLIWS